MSAWVVDKRHVDLLVRAGLELRDAHGHPGIHRCTWWRVDEQGGYAGWRTLDPYALDEDEETFSPSQLGQILVDENVASVLYRYPDCTAEAGDLPGPVDAYYMGPYVYADPGKVLSPGEVFKAIDCLDYQSCEHPGWRSSEAYAFLTSLRDNYCRRVADYEEAPWGYDSVPA